MFYTHTITLERLEDINQQVTNGNKVIDICEQEYCILFRMKLPQRNTRKKELVLSLRNFFAKKQPN